MSIKIKNSKGEMVYEYSGASSGVTEGVIYSGNNDCENCKAPEKLSAEITTVDGKKGVLISWEKVGMPKSYKVYVSDDYENYKEIATVESTENQYFDVRDAVGTYYYKVTAYNDDCESMPAVTEDGNSDCVMVIWAMALDENAVAAIVYPNPASEKLNISAEGMTTVMVFNAIGQKVISLDVDADEIGLDVSSLNNGIYMLKVATRNGVFTRKINVVQ